MDLGGITIRWQDILEILILSFIIYRFLLFIQGRRALQVLLGLLVIIFAGIISQILHLEIISWILKNLFVAWAIFLIIVFQPEIRRGLARIGKTPFFFWDEQESVIDEIINAVNFLSRNKYGALIVIQQEVGLRDYMESGVTIDARVSSELLISIFTPHTPLHDGAVIIEDDRIAASNCILPIKEEDLDIRHMGSRHRAALTLSKETDAAILVVSEETGKISLALRGSIRTDLDGISLRDEIVKLSNKKTVSSNKFFVRWTTRGK
ncbi:MAG: diadenylate cyclase CdaA [Candidatus Ratteibacteria bacterium]|nr:diadenylate cyclase CdaA [Candidatus Ratteibacteria bacterium]